MSWLSSAAVFTNLGIICQDTLRRDEAIAHYKKAIKISPDNPGIYAKLGSLYKGIGSLDLALSFTLKSLELKPSN